MALAADVFERREPWRGPLALSAVLHAGFVGLVVGWAVVIGFGPHEQWGGANAGEGAMNATLVSSATIPLPKPTTPTQNIVANESQGIAHSQPKQEVTPPPEAVPIPEVTKPKPKPKPQTSTIAKAQPQEPPNVVPFGEGGQVAQNYSVFKTSIGSGGIAALTGDFGSRYAWYVDAVRRTVQQAWLAYEVDPHTPQGARVYLTFDIGRDGRPASIQIEKQSGFPTLDVSAVRAMQRIDTFGPLPPDYRGSKVAVEFYFDYKR